MATRDERAGSRSEAADEFHWTSWSLPRGTWWVAMGFCVAAALAQHLVFEPGHWWDSRPRIASFPAMARGRPISIHSVPTWVGGFGYCILGGLLLGLLAGAWRRRDRCLVMLCVLGTAWIAGLGLGLVISWFATQQPPVFDF